MTENKNLEKKVIIGLFWKFLERFSAQLVSLVVSIILARLLSPEEYGTISIVNVIICLANVFVVSGFGSALIQKKDADGVDFTTVFYFNLLFSLVIYVLLFLMAPIISKFYKMPDLEKVFKVLALSVIIAAINSIQHAYVSKHMLFFRFFWATLIGTIISAVIGISMAYYGCGVWALVAQHLSNMIIDTFVLWITVKWRPNSRVDIRRLKPLISFGWKLLLDNLFTSVYNNFKSLVIGKVYTPSDLAFYSKGVQFPDLIVVNINSSISSVLFPAYSQIQDEIEKLKKAVRKSIEMSAFFLTPALVGLFVVAPNFISLLLTEKWLPCVPYLRIACLYYIFFPVTTTDSEALLALGKSGISLFLTIIKRVAGIVLILLAVKKGVMAIVITDLIIVLISVSLNFCFMKYFFNYTLKEQLADIIPCFFTSALMGMGVFAVTKMINMAPLYVVLLVQIIVGGVSYIGLSMLFNRKSTLYIINKIMKKKNK